MKPDSPMPRLLDMHEAALFLKIDYDTMRAYVKAGLIAAVRYPSLAKKGPRRKKLFRQETLEQFMLESEVTENRTNSCTKRPVQTARNYPKGWHEEVLSRTSKS